MAMDRIEAGKFIGNTIQKALAGGVHQLDLVAILEAHKHSLLTQAYEANKNKSDDGGITMQFAPTKRN